MEIKVTKRGNICIPKQICSEYGFLIATSLECDFIGGEIVLKPKYKCSRCGKPLTDELKKRRACPDCEPCKIETVEIY